MITLEGISKVPKFLGHRFFQRVDEPDRQLLGSRRGELCCSPRGQLRKTTIKEISNRRN